METVIVPRPERSNATAAYNHHCKSRSSVCETIVAPRPQHRPSNRGSVRKRTCEIIHRTEEKDQDDACHFGSQKSGPFENRFGYLVASLNACSKQRNLDKGCRIHRNIKEKDALLEKDAVIGNALLNMYAKCGALGKAQEVFDLLCSRDVISWTILIAAYAEYGDGMDALSCFGMMQYEGVLPDSFVYTCTLKACSRIGAVDKGQEIHAEIIKQGLLKKNIMVGNALVDMYAKCGNLATARMVLDELPKQDVVSWNALIKGYLNHGSCEEAVECFEQMQKKGLTPSVITFVFVLNACARIGASAKGQEVHSQASMLGLLTNNIQVGNALIDMYAKCSLLEKAQEVFDELLVRDVVSWTALITGYAQHGYGEEAMRCFEQMKCEGICPNVVTYIRILQACGAIGTTNNGKMIHALIIRDVVQKEGILIGNALVDMYAKCGALAKAQEVFDGLPVRDVILWTLLIAAYTEQGLSEEAFNIFERMKADGFFPNPVTFVCILKACGNVGAAIKGQEIHAEILREGLVEKDILIGNALVDMYAKCGILSKAQEIFNGLRVKDVISWTTLMAGYAQIGNHDAVFTLFNKMTEEEITPDLATFSIILNTCCHSGLVDKGQIYFNNMSKVFGIIPNLEHYTCMVDLYGRAGDLDKAVALIENIPFSGDVTVWRSLLGSCREWGNVNLGRLAFERAIQLDSEDAAAYVSMYNVYATEDAKKTKLFECFDDESPVD